VEGRCKKREKMGKGTGKRGKLKGFFGLKGRATEEGGLKGRKQKNLFSERGIKNRLTSGWGASSK